MVAGNPELRNYTATETQEAVLYACLNYNGPATPQTNGFPTVNCPDGLRSQVYFPSCWDGVNLDSADHKSHMAYPVDGFDHGTCPDSHPQPLISLFYEIIWNTPDFANDWYGSGQPFVWSMGDPTGYGFHGDFVSEPSYYRLCTDADWDRIGQWLGREPTSEGGYSVYFQ